MKRPDLFKKLVGGGKDSITVRQIYGKPFDMINHAKMCFSANGIPILPKDADPAYFNRWLPIPFPNVFQGESDDKDIVKTFTTPEQLSAILKWALDGLKRLKKNNWIFTNQPSREELMGFFGAVGKKATKEIQIEDFVENCLIHDKEYAVDRSAVYAFYQIWCKIFHIEPYDMTWFFRKLYNSLEVTSPKDRLYQPQAGSEDSQIHALPNYRININNKYIWRFLREECGLSRDEAIKQLSKKRYNLYTIQKINPIKNIITKVGEIR